MKVSPAKPGLSVVTDMIDAGSDDEEDTTEEAEMSELSGSFAEGTPGQVKMVSTLTIEHGGEGTHQGRTGSTPACLEPSPPKKGAASKLRPLQPSDDSKKVGKQPLTSPERVYRPQSRGRRTAMMAGQMDANEAERLTDLMVDSLHSNNRGSTGKSNLAIKVRGFSSLLLTISLIAYEIFWFEWADYKERGAHHGEFGFTGPTVLWAFTMLWSLSQVIYSFMQLGSARFRSFSHEQQLKVVKYCIQITWGGTMAVLYTIFHLYVAGFLSSECAEIPTAMLPPGKSAAQAGYCLAEWSWSYSHIVSLFASLYIWELVHEGFMIHGSLAAHHLSIIALWQLIIGYYTTRDWISLVQLKAIADIGVGQLLAVRALACFQSSQHHRPPSIHPSIHPFIYLSATEHAPS